MKLSHIRAILLISGAALMAISSYQMWNLPLWSYWAMFLGVGFSLLMAGLILSRSIPFKYIIYALVSAVLLATSFPPSPFPFLSFAGFVPLLYLISKKLKWHQAFKLFYLAFFTWANLATFWVVNTAFGAGLFSTFVNAFIMSLTFLGVRYVFLKMNANLHLLGFVGLWIFFEYFHFLWQLRFPWLSLGNGLATWPFAIQWYKYTGFLGGSVWILLVNFFLYKMLLNRRYNYKNGLGILSLILLPILFSLFVKKEHWRDNPKINVAIIQPNFEPHYEKFQIPEREQIKKINHLLREAVDSSTQLVVLPETVFQLRLNSFDREPSIRMLRSIMNQYPNLEILFGASTQRILETSEQDDLYTRTHTYSNGKKIRWEAGNTAIYLKKDTFDIYYKNILVPGAEFFPYYTFLSFLEPLVKQLGGSIKGLRSDGKTNVFHGQASIAPIICYESIFTDYCRGFVAQGANLFTVITNDGWWDYTPGHMQHLAYARILAISHQRSIARSANTGTSAFVLPNGEIHKPTMYEEDAIIKMKLPLNREITPYARWGDLIGRISVFVVFVLLFQAIRNSLKAWVKDK